MKNIKNIIEQKNPPEDPNVLWLKDDTLYKSTSKGWVPLNESPSITEHYEDHKSTLTYTGSDGKEHAVITDGSFTPNNDGDIVITDSNNEEHTIVTEENLNEILSNGTVVPITWQELKDKRDNGELIPGSLYRITDYQCTTTQENTQSAGHQFDIVLLALSENKLAEEGWAMMNESNIYDVTFKNGVTKKCYLYCTNEEDKEYNIVDVATLLGDTNFDLGGTIISIDEENKKAIVDSSSSNLTYPDVTYNYFQNSNLSAWKVWYCLDNDKSRFAWADDNTPAIKDLEGYGVNVLLVRDSTKDNFDAYAWFNEAEDAILYTMNPIPKIGDVTYEEGDNELVAFGQVGVVQGFGRGVIYRLIDEFNNDIKYDFKNIQFKRKLTNGQYDKNGTETWCYTLNIWYNDMCQDASIVGNTLLNDEGFVSGVYDNKFGYATACNLYIEGVNTFAFALGDNVVLSVLDEYYYGIFSNTIGNSFYKNTIGDSFSDNTIGNRFNSNTIGNFFQSNTIRDGFSANVIGNDFYSNTIGTSFIDNTIKTTFNSNMVGNDFTNKTINDSTNYKNYGNRGVELATKS